MKKFSRFLLFLSMLLITTPLFAAESCISLLSKIDPSVFELTSVEQNLISNNFTTDRSLVDYSKELDGPLFTKALKNLNENSIWIDMGAGKALAQRQLLKEKNIKEAISLAVKKPDDEDLNADLIKFHDQFKYFEGELLNDLIKTKKLDQYRGKVNLITDVFGPASYSKELSEVIQAYGDLISIDGEIHLNIPLMSMRSEENILEYTSVSNGRTGTLFLEDGLLEWFKSFKGLQVIKTIQTGHNDISIAVVLKKISNDIDIPKLQLIDFDGLRGPPTRKFFISKNSDEFKYKSWSPFQKTQDGIPLRHLKVKRKIDKTDMHMMATSFRHKIGNGQPVETAFVDILDKDGNTLVTSEIITGTVGEVRVASIINHAFSTCKQYSNAKLIRFRHTHPGSWKGSNLSFYASWKFSESDIKLNQTIRDEMNKDGFLQKIDFEAYIVYVRPTVTSFSETLEHFWQIIETKGYGLPGK